MLIKLENNKPTGNPILPENFKQLFPGITFPVILTPEVVEPYGYGLYDFSSPVDERGRYEKFVEVDPVKNENGVWIQTWSKISMTNEEKNAVDENQKIIERYERTRKLKDTDWTIGNDSPLSEAKKEQFRLYRQQLRDVPSQPGFPWNITWPTSP